VDAVEQLLAVRRTARWSPEMRELAERLPANERQTLMELAGLLNARPVQDGPERTEE
jgi:hypothetical protein